MGNDHAPTSASARHGEQPSWPPLGMRDAVPDARLSFKRLEIVAGLEVGHFRFLPGETAYPPLPGHIVNLHLGPETRLVTRRRGATWEGTQPSGRVEVFAAGTATEQVLRDPSEDVSLLLPDTYLRGVAFRAELDPDRIEVIDRFDLDDPTVAAILRLLLGELATAGLGGELYVQSLATTLALHLLRHHAVVGDRAAARLGASASGGLPAPVARRVLVYIEANLAERLVLDDLAALAELSPRHFLRLFKASTGYSPHQYLIRRRLARASDLLARTDLPLAAVARESGFAHQQHLTTHFTRAAGTSPGRFRAEATASSVRPHATPRE